MYSAYSALFSHYDKLFKDNNLPIDSDDWQEPWVMYSNIGKSDIYEVYVEIHQDQEEPMRVAFGVYDWNFAKTFKSEFNYTEYDMMNLAIETEKEGEFFEFSYETEDDDEMIKFIKEILELIDKANLRTHKELYETK